MPKRYSSAGAPLGGEFRVNSYTTGATKPVSGSSSVTNPANWRLTRNCADVSGRITGITFGLKAATNRYEAILSLNAPLTDGNYGLTARHTLVDQNGNRLDGQFNGSGFASDFNLPFTVARAVAAGPEFRVNSYTTSDQDTPAVAIDPAGNYIVTWESYDQDGSANGVYAQRYSAAGSPIGGEFRVNTFTTGFQ